MKIFHQISTMEMISALCGLWQVIAKFSNWKQQILTIFHSFWGPGTQYWLSWVVLAYKVMIKPLTGTTVSSGLTGRMCCLADLISPLSAACWSEVAAPPHLGLS